MNKIFCITMLLCLSALFTVAYADPPPPVECTLTATPQILPPDGGEVVLRWTSSGADRGTVIIGNEAGGATSELQLLNGSSELDVSSDTDFLAVFRGPGSKASCTTSVEVIDVEGCVVIYATEATAYANSEPVSGATVATVVCSR